jgi:hypothetical protein
VSGGRLDVRAPVVEGIIFYEIRDAETERERIACNLLLECEDSDGWLIVEKKSISEDVILFDENNPEYLRPGTMVRCLFIGTADDYDGRVHFALVLKKLYALEKGYERIGLLVCGTANLLCFNNAFETTLSIF